jgi:hypothetical protein
MSATASAAVATTLSTVHPFPEGPSPTILPDAARTVNAR